MGGYVAPLFVMCSLKRACPRNCPSLSSYPPQCRFQSLVGEKGRERDCVDPHSVLSWQLRED